MDKTKKAYRRPVLGTVEIKLGVFGSYAPDYSCASGEAATRPKGGILDLFGGLDAVNGGGD